MILCVTLAISMAVAVPVPGRKHWVRTLFDEHNNPVVLPYYRPHHIILPIDDNRHRVVNPHPIESHKFPEARHHPSPSATGKMSSGAVQGLVTNLRILGPDDAPADAPEDFFDEMTGNDKRHTQKTKEQLEAEKEE